MAGILTDARPLGNGGFATATAERVFQYNSRMAKTFEWLVIRVETLYKLAILLVVIIAAAIGIWFVRRGSVPDAMEKARQQVTKVTGTLNEVKDSCDPALKAKLSDAYTAIAAANDALKANDAKGAADAAGKAKSIAEKVAEECSGPTRATVVGIQGSVEVKKGDKPDYEPLKRNMRLDPGDVIRTGTGGQVIIKYPDETLQSIGADTLYVIRGFERTASGGFVLDSVLKEGSIDINRPANSPADTKFQVATEQDVTASVNPGSRTAIADSEKGGTQVVVVAGSADVSHAGSTQTVQSGTKVSAASSAAALVQTAVPRPPLLISPADQQVVNSEANQAPEVIFQWAPAEGAAGYVLQIGGDPFLTTENLLAEQKLPASATKVTIKLPPGAAGYYWRVRANDDKTPPGAVDNLIWSYTFGFRVLQKKNPASASNCVGSVPGPGCQPLDLKCSLVPLAWDTVIVNCQTTPGLLLTIDGIGCELVDGRCRKIKTFSAAGDQKIQITVSDNYGSQKSQTLVYHVQPQ